MMSMVNKQQKMMIAAFSNEERSKHIGFFEALFNPQTIKQSAKVDYSPRQGINTSNQTQHYMSTPAQRLSVKLLLDGTGQMTSVLAKQGGSIAQKIEKFTSLTQQYNGEIHQPNFLCIKWGDINFNCRLQTLDINYTLFNDEGKVLSAELDCTFIGDEAAKTIAKKEHKQSPDMTHVRYIDAATNLSLIANDIYQSPTYYLALARYNKLINFRSLAYGQKIICPPLSDLMATTSIS